MIIKYCKTCGPLLPGEVIIRFDKRFGSTYKFCNICYNKSKRKYTIKNRETLRIKSAEWKKANPDKVNLCRKSWRDRNKEYHREETRKWYQRNKAALQEKLRARAKHDIDTLHPNYIKQLLIGRSRTLKTKDIPTELIELKTITMKIRKVLMEEQK